MTTLTAPLVDRDLTAPERAVGETVLIVRDGDTRITRAGNIRVTRGGNTRIARNNYYGSFPLLTAPLVDRQLTAQERQ